MTERREYLNQLSNWKDHQISKVVIGIRRCSKSVLLAQFQDLLKDNGVEPSQIISINFEDLDYEELLDYRKLHSYIKERLIPDKQNYIFLDEIQMVESYEKVVDSLHIKDNVDLYITGSNSYMLSGDLATLLTGRYIEIKMLPLSFRKYAMEKQESSDAAFAEYLNWSSFPFAVTTLNPKNGDLNSYLEGIYTSVMFKDIEQRMIRKANGKSSQAAFDVVLFGQIGKYLASAIGSQVSVRKITNYLTSTNRKISPNTVSTYVRALCDSFVFYEVPRFDISGKELLKTNSKFYIVDLGLQNYLLPKRTYDLGCSLENIVYFELLRRGFEVYVGKLEKTEVDFAARKNSEMIYIQVTADMKAQETFEREMRPLKQIKDNYPKIILTLDRFTPGNYDGIQVIQIVDWLLEDKAYNS